MSNRRYTVKPEDSWQSIAKRVYGDPALSVLLQNANATQYLSVGQNIIVPPAPNRRGALQSVLSDKGPEELTILIGGVEITPESARIYRGMDSAVDSWRAVIPWIPGENERLDRALRPFSYPDAFIYIGGKLVISGALYGVSPLLSDRREMSIEGFSYTADVVDSCLSPPYQWFNIKLGAHARDLLKPLGIGVTFDVSDGEVFGVIDAEPQSKLFDHLYKLAFQRGLLITSSPDGGLVFTQAKKGASVGTLREGTPPVLSWGASFDGRKRFNSYRAYGYSPLAGDKAVVALDDNVPRSRTLAFQVDDTYTYDIGYAAEWKRAKQVADSIEIKLPLEGWLTPKGEVWDFNTLVTVISDTLMVPDGFTFLIRSVELELNKSARTAEISIVPPTAYAKRGTRAVDPWT